MRGVRAATAGAFLVVLGLVGTSGAADVTDHDRLFTDYMRETATVERGQLRVEIQGIARHAEQTSDGLQIIQRGFPAGDRGRGERRDDISQVTGGQLDLIGSYGVLQNLEVGFDFVGILQGLRFMDGTAENNNALGDMKVYGKFKFSLTDHTAVGGGMDVRLATGSEEKRTGTGQTGVEPFLSVRYTHGPFGVGALLGYEFNPGNAQGSRHLSNVFHWSTHGTIRIRDSFAFRTEMVGRHFDYGGATFDDISLMPGIDYNFTKSITIRPTGLAGLTDEAFDWGVGIGAAMVF